MSFLMPSIKRVSHYCVSAISNAWYTNKKWVFLLLPLEWLYIWVIKRRQRTYLLGKESVWQPSVPLIVVGNLTVGGTGKSPLVAHLVQHLQTLGFKPGIISRGYKGSAQSYPLWVTPSIVTVEEAGDEALMLAQQTKVPVVVDPNRVRAAQYLLNQSDCNVIISDDGLQHLRLGRDIEIVVIDGQRQLGNGHCLPVGPLREPPIRLQRVHYVIVNGVTSHEDGYGMQFKPNRWVHLVSGESIDIHKWHHGQTVHAVAGIGNPHRFFETLRKLNFDVIEHIFEDHYQFRRDDIIFDDEYPIIMTTKDAIKCNTFVTDLHWALEIDPKVEEKFYKSFEFQMQMLSIAKNCEAKRR